ncbi:Hypothetical protein MVR_LOCUS331 [uncultured virus]|nr:Hypothetical protein MVR_LOCUS331 [uncultured virus]
MDGKQGDHYIGILFDIVKLIINSGHKQIDMSTLSQLGAVSVKDNMIQLGNYYDDLVNTHDSNLQAQAIDLTDDAVVLLRPIDMTCNLDQLGPTQALPYRKNARL